MAALIHKLYFRCWNGSGYLWQDYTDRLSSLTDISALAEATDFGYRASYPAMSSIKVINNDRAWNDVATYLPHLGDAMQFGEPYSIGLRGRLVRVTEVCGVDERAIFTGAVADLTTQIDEPTATLEVVGMGRLAAEQKCDQEMIDDSLLWGDWAANPHALYRDRAQDEDGSWLLQWHTYRRVYALAQRTLMPRTDDATHASIENVLLRTREPSGTNRRTAVATTCSVQPPASGDYELVLGCCWGDPATAICYMAVQKHTGSTDALYMREFDYVTGDWTDYLILTGYAGGQLSIAGMFYNPQSKHDTVACPKIYVAATDATGSPTRGWIIEYRPVVHIAYVVELADPTIPTGEWFESSFGFCPSRDSLSGAIPTQGTFWIMSYVHSGLGFGARLREFACQDIEHEFIVNGKLLALNDSSSTYLDGIPPTFSACVNYEAAAGQVESGVGAIDIYLIRGAPDEIIRCSYDGSVWQTPFFVYGSAVQFGEPAYPLALCELPMEFNATPGNGNFRDLLLCKQITAYGVVRYGLVHLWDNGTPGSPVPVLDTIDQDFQDNVQLCVDYTEPRIYYVTAAQTDHTTAQILPFQAKLRSLTWTTSPNRALVGPIDENRNPSSNHVGDPLTSVHCCSGYSTALTVRTAGFRPGAPPQIHGILLSGTVDPVLFSYAQEFYPSVPLVELSGITLHDFRSKLADLCNCVQSYDAWGYWHFTPRMVTPTGVWPDGKVNCISSGWKDIKTWAVTKGYTIKRSEDTRRVLITFISGEGYYGPSPAPAQTVNGVIENVSCGQWPMVNHYRVVVYAVDTHVGTQVTIWKLGDGLWQYWNTDSSSWGTSVDGTWYPWDQSASQQWLQPTHAPTLANPIDADGVSHRYTPDALTLEGRNFIGQFGRGDTFDLKAFPSRLELYEDDYPNRIELKNADSALRWRNAISGQSDPDRPGNKFVPRAQLYDVTQSWLDWHSVPHRTWELTCGASEIVDLFEARVLVLPDELNPSDLPNPTAFCIGIAYHPFEPWKTLTLIEQVLSDDGMQELSTGTFYWQLVTVPAAITLSGYQFTLLADAPGNGATSAALCALYTVAADGRPGSVIPGSDALWLPNEETPGTVSVNLTPTIALAAGVYWLCIGIDQQTGTPPVMVAVYGWAIRDDSSEDDFGLPNPYEGVGSVGWRLIPVVTIV